MKYKESQAEIQKIFFGSEKLGGTFRKKTYPHILKNYVDNFTQADYEEVNRYFSVNGIQWWGGRVPTNNTLSSQIACINHLFPIRNDHDAVLSLAKTIDPSFIDVVKLDNDKREDKDIYISFEVVSKTDHLNEIAGNNKKLHRGSLCTSIDAVILAKKQGNPSKNVLITIEWKYVEKYGNEDKSISPNGKKSGDVRLQRYSGLISQSEQLISCSEYRSSVYFFEPFYQLMRQTLWAEKMVENKDDEIIKADDYLTVHVIPEANENLLEKKYCSEKNNLILTWTNMLNHPEKYICISPDKLFLGLSDGKWHDLYKNLEKRYWR